MKGKHVSCLDEGLLQLGPQIEFCPNVPTFEQHELLVKPSRDLAKVYISKRLFLILRHDWPRLFIKPYRPYSYKTVIFLFVKRVKGHPGAESRAPAQLAPHTSFNDFRVVLGYESAMWNNMLQGLEPHVTFLKL